MKCAHKTITKNSNRFYYNKYNETNNNNHNQLTSVIETNINVLYQIKKEKNWI